MDDAPKSVKGMVRVIDSLGQYKWDAADVFVDFIDYGIGCFLYAGDKEMAERLQKKYGDDYPKFNEMMLAWIKIMDERICDDVDWFDALGTLYEYLASRSKKSHLGQFFTPETLCDLMTQILIGEEKTGLRINDCACGSGRMLLSFNSKNPGNLLYGEDLDAICAKMTALNMAIHGCQGQATCMDTISQKWRFCYEVNPFHRRGFPAIPHLVPVQVEKCFSKLQLPKNEESMEQKHPVKTKKAVHDHSVQLSLF